MSLQPVRNIKEYTRLKQSLKNQFEREKTGEQGIFEEQTRLFQPLMKFNEEIAQKSNATFLPITEAAINVSKELKRRNDRVDMFAELPFYASSQVARGDTTRPSIASNISAASTSPDGRTAKRKRMDPKLINVDLDKFLDSSDKKTLIDLGFPLPSEAYKKGQISEVLRRIKKSKHSLVQKTSKVSKAIPVDRAVYEQQKVSLGALETHLIGISNAMLFVNSPKKGNADAPIASSSRTSRVAAAASAAAAAVANIDTANPALLAAAVPGFAAVRPSFASSPALAFASPSLAASSPVRGTPTRPSDNKGSRKGSSSGSGGSGGTMTGSTTIGKRSGKGSGVSQTCSRFAHKGKDTDIVYYRNARELAERLTTLVSSKKAGNNGVVNEINTILDELLRIKVLTKKKYDSLYKDIFS